MTHAPPLDQTLADEVPAEGARQGALTIAHFVVLRKLGEGAMGIVYAAYDTRLDRRVALKLVRRDRPERGDSHGRVLREAQGLARLSHPNVVQIYEVGEVGDRLFLAMEYLDGQTLRAWLRERPRSWSAVLATFVAAGRGLAAAHAARLVHRDFKPESGSMSQVPENTRVSRLRRGCVPSLYQARGPVKRIPHARNARETPGRHPPRPSGGFRRERRRGCRRCSVMRFSLAPSNR